MMVFRTQIFQHKVVNKVRYSSHTIQLFAFDCEDFHRFLTKYHLPLLFTLGSIYMRCGWMALTTKGLILTALATVTIVIGIFADVSRDFLIRVKDRELLSYKSLSLFSKVKYVGKKLSQSILTGFQVYVWWRQPSDKQAIASSWIYGFKGAYVKQAILTAIVSITVYIVVSVKYIWQPQPPLPDKPMVPFGYVIIQLLIFAVFALKQFDAFYKARQKLELAAINDDDLFAPSTTDVCHAVYLDPKMVILFSKHLEKMEATQKWSVRTNRVAKIVWVLFGWYRHTINRQ